MGRATLLKNAVSEVVAIRELVHWVTALVARVSCFFSFFGHTVPFLGIFIVHAFYFFNSTVIIFCFYMLLFYCVFVLGESVSFT